MGIQESLSLALAKLKPIWLDFMETLITGECGCHFAVKILTSKIHKTCNTNDNQLAMFQSKTCTESTEVFEEEIDMPVFFSGSRFPNGLSFYVPQGYIKILTTKENITKLQKSDKIEVSGEFYIKASEQQPCGWDVDYTFYSMEFKKCQ